MRMRIIAVISRESEWTIEKIVLKLKPFEYGEIRHTRKQRL